MSLRESYRSVRTSIVAFVPRFRDPAYANDQSQEFPPIIGTGFILNANGLIATNDHVVEEFGKFGFPPGSKARFPVVALLLHLTAEGVVHIPMEIIEVDRISGYSGGEKYYGPPKPDLAFVLVNMRGLPALELDHTPVEEGDEVATAGFPMGTDALRPDGWLEQLGPTLQRGIVSAVLPFPCQHIHGFTINVMVQGGASGSPVFNPASGAVLGVLHSGLDEMEKTHKLKESYRVPTNISYVIPSGVIDNAIRFIEKDGVLSVTERAPVLAEILTAAKYEELHEGGSIHDTFSSRSPMSSKVSVRKVWPDTG